MDSLDEGASVLVAAPTGSGKTLVAEYAIDMAIGGGRRAFYTAPIKALSNQKFADFQGLFGASRVGLLTGDNSINQDADIVVMTTEVLRNMIYTGSHRLEDLGVVVLDEVHFLQDAYRGPVWEEVIIQLDPTVQLVCLSATVSNASEVGEWLSTVRGRTDVIVETTRPVTLLHHHAFRDRATGETAIHESVVGSAPNERLRRLIAASGAPHRGGPRRRGGKGRFSTPSRPEVVELLSRREMLPAIVFIFSRAQCEDAVSACVREGLLLTTPEERDEIASVLEDHCQALSPEDRSTLDFEGFLSDVMTGVACHHAGMIPMFKEAVERCFIAGLIKVVFATETLAVGINMPARSVVIEKLTKFTGEHHSLLKASEFTQLTGRAGRRGLDSIGHAVTLWNPFVSFDQMMALALSRSFALSSAFRPTFNMAANMVRIHSRAGAMHVLNLSFAQFQADREVVAVEAQMERRRRELAMLERSQETGAQAEVPESGPRRSASVTEAEIALRGLRPGDVAVFDASNLRGRGLVIATASRRSGTRLSVLTASRKTVEITVRDLRSLPSRAGRVDLPTPFEPSRSDFVREASSRLVRAKLAESATIPLVLDGEAAPAPKPEAKARALRRDLERLAGRAEHRSGSVAARFLDVIELLEELEYVRGWELTDKGRILSGIFHESDLLLVELMSRGVLNGLGVVDLLCVLSTLVYEPRGGLEAAAPRWPSESARKRFRRIEKISLEVQDHERSRGMTAHRAPHPGIVWEVAEWAKGAPLSRVLDPDITPGDFVRVVRQMIDLLRQLSATSPPLAGVCADAERAINRGVVASAMTGIP